MKYERKGKQKFLNEIYSVLSHIWNIFFKKGKKTKRQSKSITTFPQNYSTATACYFLKSTQGSSLKNRCSARVASIKVESILNLGECRRVEICVCRHSPNDQIPNKINVVVPGSSRIQTNTVPNWIMVLRCGTSTSETQRELSKSLSLWFECQRARLVGMGRPQRQLRWLYIPRGLINCPLVGSYIYLCIFFFFFVTIKQITHTQTHNDTLCWLFFFFVVLVSRAGDADDELAIDFVGFTVSDFFSC